jgi:hypothetical protein
MGSTKRAFPANSLLLKALLRAEKDVCVLCRWHLVVCRLEGQLFWYLRAAGRFQQVGFKTADLPVGKQLSATQVTFHPKHMLDAFSGKRANFLHKMQIRKAIDNYWRQADVTFFEKTIQFFFIKMSNLTFQEIHIFLHLYKFFLTFQPIFNRCF